MLWATRLSYLNDRLTYMISYVVTVAHWAQACQGLILYNLAHPPSYGRVGDSLPRILSLLPALYIKINIRLKRHKEASTEDASE
jgi:hypothetical protein